uniref:Phosphate transporter n=1 Tax=Bursaphelenchus xylophilus TaxID=6326 RepID=A0A1I7RSA4_BURXY
MEATTAVVIEAIRGTYLWALILGICLSFLLGFGMGANDVANAFGTSVGSKTLSLRQAYILATIFETLGSILVGYKVTDALRKEIVEVNIYKDDVTALFFGQIAILGGGAAWLIIATVLKAPVSTTHSVVGATLGFTLVMKGMQGIHWSKVGSIAMSWIISPCLSGIISSLLYILIDHTVLRRKDPVKCGLRALPVFYFVCIAFNVFAVLLDGSYLLNLEHLQWYITLSVSLALGLLSGLVFHFFLSSRLLNWINKTEEKKINAQMVNPAMIAEGLSTDVLEREPEKKNKKQKLKPTLRGFVFWFFPYQKQEEDPRTLRLFSAIQVFTACFAGFAHGANDVSNSIAPLAALIAIYDKQNEELAMSSPTPLYVICFGIVSTCIGLWVLGHFVIRTVGQEMSQINPAR